MTASSDLVDVLAVGAHPDDVELCAGGTVCRLVADGYRVGILDLTRGELGTRGTVQDRDVEAAAAAEILGVSVRQNLGLPDGGIINTAESRLPYIRAIRRFRPRIVLLNSPVCRHPDHCAAAALGRDASFYSGLRKIQTFWGGDEQEPFRPQHILHYMQAVPFEPTFVVDVSSVWEQRMKALLAYRSQFHVPEYKEHSGEPETYVSNPAFLEWVSARARAYGYQVGAEFGEPLLYVGGPVGISDLAGTLSRDQPFR